MRHRTRTRTIAGLSLVGLLLSAVPAAAQTAAPIDYTLSFPAPHTHYVDVVAEVPTDGAAEIELMMAVWTPGSYLVREFARHIENIRAQAPDGTPLSIVKTRKNRWQVATQGHPRVIVSYQVYGREMSVRTNWIESDFAMLNGAPTFLTLADETRPRPHDVTLELPAHWYRSMTGLTPRADRAPHSYRAVDFDTLVDTLANRFFNVSQHQQYQLSINDALANGQSRIGPIAAFESGFRPSISRLPLPKSCSFSN